MIIYQGIHYYDEDGGFGDAVQCSKVVGTFENKDDAKAFVSKFSKPIIYDRPYSDLRCGYLEVKEVNIISHKEFNIDKIDTDDFWWLKMEKRGDYDE